MLKVHKVLFGETPSLVVLLYQVQMFLQYILI